MRRFFDKISPEPNSGCWLWTGALQKQGYGTFKLNTRQTILAHRFSWLFHRGPIPEGLHICHHCDVRSCVNPDHLFLGTDQDNTEDKMRKGRHAAQTGAKAAWRNGVTRLTTSDILEIRRRVAAGELQRLIAADYGVYQSHVSSIASRRKWRHV